MYKQAGLKLESIVSVKLITDEVEEEESEEEDPVEEEEPGEEEPEEGDEPEDGDTEPND